MVNDERTRGSTTLRALHESRKRRAGRGRQLLVDCSIVFLGGAGFG